MGMARTTHSNLSRHLLLRGAQNNEAGGSGVAQDNIYLLMTTSHTNVTPSHTKSFVEMQHKMVAM